jgi:hypothetical protein
MDELTYIAIAPEGPLPPAFKAEPFRAVLVADVQVSDHWRASVADWLVISGCRYMIAWGADCSAWDDAVDEASVLRENFNADDESQFVMTTWHEAEPLADVFWFAKNSAAHPALSFNLTLLVHITGDERKGDLEAMFKAA